MIFGAKVVIILEKKRILYLQFGYLALFRLVIWLNNIWSFGFLPLGYLAKCCTVIWSKFIRPFVTSRL